MTRVAIPALPILLLAAVGSYIGLNGFGLFIGGLAFPFLIGIVAFFGLPLAGRATLGGKGNEGIANWYGELGQQALAPALLVNGQDAGWTLRSASYNADGFGLWSVVIGGDRQHFEDKANLMGRLANKPFGLADGKNNVIVSARMAGVAERRYALTADGNDRLTNSGETYIHDVVPIDPASERLVNLDYARKAIAASETADLADTVANFTEKGQSIFDQNPTLQYIVWFMGLGAGFGMMMIAAQYGASTGGAGGGGGGSTLPVALALWGAVKP